MSFMEDAIDTYSDLKSKEKHNIGYNGLKVNRAGQVGRRGPGMDG